MEFRRFHHPDLSLPVLTRSVGEELVELLCETLEILTTRGRSYVYRDCFPSQRSYYSAVERLRKQGLVAAVIPGKRGILRLTDAGRDSIPEYFRPERFWKRRWDKRWYLLLYDVPERSRVYRRTLHTFLKQGRLGHLQKSAWISPDDLRPVYMDLQTAAGFREFGMVFEAQSVMSEGTDQIVHDAWPMHRLRRIQALYLDVYGGNLKTLLSLATTRPRILQHAREELSDYASAMIEDPLLPNALLPSDYLGKEVHALHSAWVRALAQRL